MAKNKPPTSGREFLLRWLGAISPPGNATTGHPSLDLAQLALALAVVFCLITLVLSLTVAVVLWLLGIEHPAWSVHLIRLGGAVAAPVFTGAAIRWRRTRREPQPPPAGLEPNEESTKPDPPLRETDLDAA
jgi:hypothetical protein